MARDIQASNQRTLVRLVFVALGMFAFGFALVPLYDVFCDITGLNGKTGRLEASQLAPDQVDRTRLVTVEFIGSVNSDLPWNFKPGQASIQVHPGQLTDAVFVASNRSKHDLVGQAVPSVAPSKASRYFNKTECFCFTQQVLKSGETKEMALRFVVDPNLPKDVKRITLAYTFFPVQENLVAGKPANTNGS